MRVSYGPTVNVSSAPLLYHPSCSMRGVANIVTLGDSP